MALKSELVTEIAALNKEIELLTGIIEEDEDKDFSLDTILELKEQLESYEFIGDKYINTLDDEFRAKSCLNIFQRMTTEQIELIENQYC